MFDQVGDAPLSSFVAKACDEPLVLRVARKDKHTTDCHTRRPRGSTDGT